MKPRKPWKKKPYQWKRSEMPARKQKLRPYSAKTARVKRAMQSQEDLFRLEFDYCGVCGGSGFYEYGQPLMQNHHICGGAEKSGRGHRRENWIILCNLCHLQLHQGSIIHKGRRLPPLTNGNVLFAKRQVDPLYFDLKVLLDLKGWKNLKEDWIPARPHEFYLGA